MSTQRLPASLHETIDAFEDVDGPEPLTTTEVADRLDLGRRSTYTRLQRLVDAGELRSKKVGARGRVWWRPDPTGGDDGTVGEGADTASAVADGGAPEVVAGPAPTADSTAFESLEGVFREVIDALITQSTRAEIERTVCAHLTDSSAYRVAWVGDADVRTRAITVRTVAGEGTFSGSNDPIEPGRAPSDGAASRAIRTRELQVASGESANAGELMITAAVPVVHEGTGYGAVVVQAERERAFAEDERALLCHLGAVMGHAIAATERKRALMSDEVVELGFAISDVFEAVGAEESTSGTVVLEATIPLGDDDYLIYGSTPSGTMPAIEALVASEELPDWESVAYLGDEGDRARFELQLTQPPLFAAVAEAGGYVAESRIEGGDFSMCIQLPPSADVRQVVCVITDSYPDIELVTRRQVARDRPTRASLSRDPLGALTDAQRAAIEAAFQGGYFDWPRAQTGEDVASSLSISASTFHQHLRKAQERLLDAVFEDGDRGSDGSGGSGDSSGSGDTAESSASENG